jgi:predicted acyl esterase
MELDGRMDLDIWLSIVAPDTDLKASLYLVSSDGESHWLNDTMLRARYRKSAERPEMIHENEPEEFHLPPGYLFAARAVKGSQVRLILSSLNDPSYEKNWNATKPGAEQTGSGAKIAHIRLLQSPEHFDSSARKCRCSV